MSLSTASLLWYIIYIYQSLSWVFILIGWNFLWLFISSYWSQITIIDSNFQFHSINQFTCLLYGKGVITRQEHVHSHDNSLLISQLYGKCWIIHTTNWSFSVCAWLYGKWVITESNWKRKHEFLSLWKFLHIHNQLWQWHPVWVWANHILPPITANYVKCSIWKLSHINLWYDNHIFGGIYCSISTNIDLSYWTKLNLTIISNERSSHQEETFFLGISIVEVNSAMSTPVISLTCPMRCWYPKQLQINTA